MQKIFVFGDSIAYGAWDPQGGWVERLRQWLFCTTRGEYNRGTFLYNLSVVGETTAEILRRFPAEIAARQSGDLIVFAAGINDAQDVQGRPLTTPQAVCSTVRALLQQARACAPHVCWVGLTPVEEARTTPIPWMPDRVYRNAAVAAVDAAIKRTAAAAAVPYLDLFSAWTANRAYPQLLWDGIHPNAAGHAQICEAVQAFLRQYGLDPSGGRVP